MDYADRYDTSSSLYKTEPQAEQPPAQSETQIWLSQVLLYKKQN